MKRPVTSTSWFVRLTIPMVLCGCMTACTNENNSEAQVQDTQDATSNSDDFTTACPQPVIVVEEGESVTGTESLHLHGEQSVGGGDGLPVERYAWTVDQPAENDSTFEPNASASTVSHQVKISGDYKYCLDVCNAARCSSDGDCGAPICQTVHVIHNVAIHCELTWKTPGDSDQYDECAGCGTDLDIHLAHPLADGPDMNGDGIGAPWFNTPYDVYSGQPQPQWESPAADGTGNPSLDRNDTNGVGPENIIVRRPPNEGNYRLGVHYVDDNGFGPSYPRLKCYIRGEVKFDHDLSVPGITMQEGDLWYAADISWPSGEIAQVKDSEDSLSISSDYPVPDR